MERTVTVVSDVKDLSELLRGASVDQVDLALADGRIQLAVGLTRAMLEGKSTARQGWLKKPKTPWTKCQLTLKAVRGATVKRLTDQAPNEQPLLACEAVVGGYEVTVQAADDLQWVLSLERLDGAFQDVGSPIESP